MNNSILVEFYNDHFNGVIPMKPDGRIRDYLNDMLPYYLRNLAIQEIINIGHKLEGSRDSFSKDSEKEILYTVSCLKEEIKMDDYDRCISRLKRKMMFDEEPVDLSLTNEDVKKMVDEEMKSPDFQRLSYELDYFRKQLEDYIALCDKYGVVSKVITDDNVVIKKRR